MPLVTLMLGYHRPGYGSLKRIGQDLAGETFAAIFCSDRQRAYKTAEVAFGDKFPIFEDARLRECDYGEYEHEPNTFINEERPRRIYKPFPGGESYEKRTNLMKPFLDELAAKYQGKRVLVVGHRAT